jgi:uncharacterized membrane protein YwzB
MKKYFLIATLFYSLQCTAFDTWWHAECTRKAMVANGFSGDARLAVQVSNYFTDYLAVVNDLIKEHTSGKLDIATEDCYKFMHFDAIFKNEDIEKNWTLLYENTVNCIKKYATANSTKPGFRLIVFFNILGASLHIVQDFYSHSNWVNSFIEMKASPIPVWYDKTPEERKLLKMFTGAYPDGSSPGKKNHADLNKDFSSRPLNKEGVETAERASTDWVKRIMEAVPEAPWAELKSYNIQSNMAMKRFLVSLDATFLTSSSIVAGHFDGNTPAKFVFSAEKSMPKERVQAAAALALTLDQYKLNIYTPGNEHNLPSPYWSGFMVYYIVRDIAAGLKHNKTVYKKPDK